MKIRIDWGRKFLDTGRYRYRVLKIDLEPWRDHVCPICHKAFTSNPGMSYNSMDIHTDCAYGTEWDVWTQEEYLRVYGYKDDYVSSNPEAMFDVDAYYRTEQDAETLERV